MRKFNCKFFCLFSINNRIRVCKKHFQLYIKETSLLFFFFIKLEKVSLARKKKHTLLHQRERERIKKGIYKQLTQFISNEFKS